MAAVVPGAIERPNVINLDERRDPELDSLGREKRRYQPPPAIDQRVVDYKKLGRMAEVMRLLEENQSFTDHHWAELVRGNAKYWRDTSKKDHQEIKRLSNLPPLPEDYNEQHPRK